ncbi:hypothetical protein NM208_g8413 [Fusarium decemcellulare]|uniref:Uncharacterized protein n=1 Tax=Fusarium decemcellulare TaxID=57161 RepID=A0ACC1S5P4_9HYPO|nr:hypothetical protein NM208_g8413 [Fusarium decemcellulare]
MSDNPSTQYRHLLPGPSRGDPPGGAPPPKINISVPKRSAVRTACEFCRKRKAKCDGRRPRCSACIANDKECQYITHPYEAEANAVKRKHDMLQERVSEHENLYSSLKTRQPEEVDEILRRIRAGGDVKSVTDDIQQGSLLLQLTSPPTTHQRLSGVSGASSSRSGTQQHGTAHPAPPGAERHTSFVHLPRARITSPSDHPEHVFEQTWRNTQHMYVGDNVFIDLPGYTLPLSKWTSVLNNDRLLGHLLLLFWTWDTICNRILDRTMFETDLKALDPSVAARPHELRFCSPFLVNALLALYTTNQSTFDVAGDSNSRGRAFVREAERLLRVEDTHPSLPVAQGLALMYVYESALGSGETALSYQGLMQERYLALRLDEIPRSTDTALSGSRQRGEAHALSWIQWGFYVWDWKPMHGLCHRLAIQKPSRTQAWHDEATSPLCERDNPDYWWFPYPVSVVPQRSWKREIFDAECHFTEIMEQVMEFLIPLEQGSPPHHHRRKALELYSKIIDWKFTLPQRLRAESAVVPAALLLHLGVDLAIINILRPFDGFSKEEFGPFDPVAMSYAHASNAMSTIWHFRALYTLRNEHWIIQACSVCVFRVLFDIESNPIQLEAFVKACRALLELGESFPVAQEVLLSLESVVKKRRLALPSYAQDHFSSLLGDYDPDFMEFTVVKVRDHSVIVEKVDSEGHQGHFTLSGLLSAVAPRESGPD